MKIFPIRHHSPASSLLLRNFIRRELPELILIEGPSDANHLIDILTDDDTEPPVAILAYHLPESNPSKFTAQTSPCHILYPFAAYSPEYVALKEAKSLNIKTCFIDIPACVSLRFKESFQKEKGGIEFFDEITLKSGYRSFEEFWEAAFESGGMDTDKFISSMLEYAAILRQKIPPIPYLEDGESNEIENINQLREQFMCREIQRNILPDTDLNILIVCGAFHAAAIDSYFQQPVNQRNEPCLPPEIPASLTVIPYSYLRLSEESGYGAGNRAPLFYEKIYENNGDFFTASLQTMLAFMNDLHFKGYGVSLADVIEANRLSKLLAGMREKKAPGLDEIKEALTACLMHGASETVNKFLKDLITGKSIGKVSSKIGKTSLQQEFYHEIRIRKIPLNDSIETFILHLTNKIEITTSIFLHRLRLCKIPFAQKIDTITSAYDHLARAKEKWQVQWTPAVDSALIEISVMGNSFLEVCARTLNESLKSANSAYQAAEILLEIAVCDVKDLIEKAISACDTLSSEDKDFVSLAKTCQNLHALISYGASREIKPTDFADMLCRTFNRAALIMPAACKVSDDAIENVCSGITILSDLCMRSSYINTELFYSVIRPLIDSYTVHPKSAGLAASIVYLSKKIQDTELITVFSQRLSSGNTPLNSAFFLDGFLSLNKLVLVRNIPIVRMLDSFVQSINFDDFTAVLPILRRSFLSLSYSERRYFIENLSSIYNIKESKTVAAVVENISEKIQDIGKISQDLDDLF